jgi:hypothetical protein
MAEMFKSALLWLWDAFLVVMGHLAGATLATFLELFILFGPLLIAALGSHLVSRRVEQRLVQLTGLSGYIWSVGWIGTPVHELGHALMAWLFRHRVDEVKLFAPDHKTGRMGYVQHSYDPGNIYQVAGNFFIGLGPIVLGGVVLYLLAWMLLGARSFHFTFAAAGDVRSLGEIPQALLFWLGDMALTLKNLALSLDFGRWQTWLFLYLLVAVGSHVNLSPSDLRTGQAGLYLLVIILFVANVIVTLFADAPLGVFALPGRLFGYLSSVVVAGTAALLPFALVLELTGRALEKPARARR